MLDFKDLNELENLYKDYLKNMKGAEIRVNDKEVTLKGTTSALMTLFSELTLNMLKLKGVTKEEVEYAFRLGIGYEDKYKFFNSKEEINEDIYKSMGKTQTTEETTKDKIERLKKQLEEISKLGIKIGIEEEEEDE